MRRESGGESSDCVRQNGFRGQFTVAQRVEHGRVGAEESAPAHSDGREDSDRVAVGPTVGHKIRHKAEGSPNSSERCDRERHKVRVIESEQSLEHEIDLVGQPRQDLHALVGRARVST